MIISDIGNALITAATGSTPAELQNQVQDAENKLTIAISTMIGLQAIVALELLILVAIAWKERH